MAIPSSVIQVNNQNFQPLGQRRKFDAEEQAAIDKGLSQALPKIGAGFGTPLPELLASPKIAAIAGGGAAGVLGGVVGLTIGAMTVTQSKKQWPACLLGAVIGGPVLGGLAAAGAYFHRNAQNNNILDSMARLPKGATQRDMLADPVIQQEKQLEVMRAMAAASRSAPSRSNEPSLTGDLLGALLKASSEKNKAKTAEEQVRRLGPTAK